MPLQQFENISHVDAHDTPVVESGREMYSAKMKHSGRFDDITGQKFGRLLAIRPVDKQWEFQCDCGNKKLIWASNVKRGHTRSCGCFKAQCDQTRCTRKTHGRAGTSEYVAWQGMHQRCENPKDKDYKNYGARGICVDTRWSTFEPFFADLGEKPSIWHSLERDDVNGNYTPENCRWATSKEQCRNRRNNIRISAFGRTGCLADFVQVGSLDYDKAKRMIKRGMDGEKAVFAVLSDRF